MISKEYKEILEIMADAIIVVDDKSTIVFVNKQTEKMFLYDRKELIGQPIEIFVPRKIQNEHVVYRDQYVTDQKPRSIDAKKSLVGIRKDGSEIPIEIGLSPYYAADKRFTIASIRDVSVRIKIEAELRQSREILEKRVEERTADLQSANVKLKQEMNEKQRMEERARQQQAELTHVSRLSLLGEMSSGLAHELNQPLAAISNYSQGCIRRLKSGMGETESLIQAMGRITSEANRASDIITRLRKFVRKEELQRTCISVNDVVQDVLGLIDFELQNNAVTVVKTFSADIPESSIDIIQIQQVLVNLIWNAIEAMQSSEQGKRVLTVNTRKMDDNFVVISVSDTGYGIDAKIAEQLFNSFFTTKEHGVGIGLSISRTIIEDHGGKIWALANEGGGTTFEFSLPFIEK